VANPVTRKFAAVKDVTNPALFQFNKGRDCVPTGTIADNAGKVARKADPPLRGR
jgi:hypothetical protein